MSNTAANILKILNQTEISIEDLQVYLEVEKASITKTISQLNEFLTSHGLSKIIKNENIYSLPLNKTEWNIIFNNFTTLTLEEKIDYLYIKFISSGFLNLEREREILDVSRSTILRCFQSVKDDFSKNGSEYKYLHGKGLILISLSKDDKNLFSKRVMKLFLEEARLVPLRRELLNSLKNFESKERIESLYSILKSFDFSFNFFLVSFLCTIDICINVFGGFDFRNTFPILDTEKFSKIQKIIKKYGKDFSEDYFIELSYYISFLSTKDMTLEASLKNGSLAIIESMKSEFNITNLDPNIEDSLLQKIYMGIFKYENNILKIKNVSFDKEQKLILDKLNEILKNFSYDFYLADKFSIVHIIRKALIDTNFKHIKKVLLLFNEISFVEQNFFKSKLNKFAPKIYFDIEPTYIHRKCEFTDYSSYDLIISDQKITNDTFVLEYFSSIKIQTILENHSLKLGLKKTS